MLFNPIDWIILIAIISFTFSHPWPIISIKRHFLVILKKNGFIDFYIFVIISVIIYSLISASIFMFYVRNQQCVYYELTLFFYILIMVIYKGWLFIFFYINNSNQLLSSIFILIILLLLSILIQIFFGLCLYWLSFSLFLPYTFWFMYCIYINFNLWNNNLKRITKKK
jgi:tryptophan-rich sensory protein